MTRTELGVTVGVTCGLGAAFIVITIYRKKKSKPSKPGACLETQFLELLAACNWLMLIVISIG